MSGFQKKKSCFLTTYLTRDSTAQRVCLPGAGFNPPEFWSPCGLPVSGLMRVGDKICEDPGRGKTTRAPPRRPVGGGVAAAGSELAFSHPPAGPA